MKNKKNNKESEVVTAKDKIVGFLTLSAICLVLPLGTALAFGFTDLIGKDGSWHEAIVTFCGVLIFGFLFELFSLLIYKWKNKDE